MGDPVEKIAPTITFIMGPNSTESDAKSEGSRLIRDALDVERFKILNVSLEKEGLMETGLGPIKGRLYSIAFLELPFIEEVIFIHPDYDRIVNGTA